MAPIAAISLTGDTYWDNFVTAVLSAEGVIYTFGAGLSGQLGRPANSSSGGECERPVRALQLLGEMQQSLVLRIRLVGYSQMQLRAKRERL